MTATYTTDEGAQIDLINKQNRTVELEIDLQRPLSAYTYKMQVKKDADTLLTLDLSDGITINGTKLKLLISDEDMDLPTGVYSYDLIEMYAGKAITIMYGNFIIEPSVTTP